MTGCIRLEKKFWRLLALSLALLPASAKAQEAMEVRALQYSLSRLGHYSSDVDGKMGPGTRQAIASYAEQNNVGDGFDNVFRDLAHATLPWEVEWSASLEDAAMSALQTSLRDFESAQFSGVHIAHRSEDGRWVSACIDVNARNGYGGYTGYQWVFLKGLRATVGNREIYTFFMENLSDYEASYLCRLGFVLELGE